MGGGSMTITKEGNLFALYEGSFASFYTVNKMPIKHLKIHFSPIQDGTPSPYDVKEIDGWNNIKYANLIDESSYYSKRTANEISGIHYDYDYSSYPCHVKIYGTSTAYNWNPIVIRDNVVENQKYYLYNLKLLDYQGWLYGNGTSYSMIASDPNNAIGTCMIGFPITCTGNRQIRLYFRQL